ncbi:MAG: NAD-dependent epimerase/dehydratase family protein [Chloroflexota bacterium]|nr:MAG: NAD-dependent epimerase/dehydratase family protein [Chloroflexota bacterium]
MDILILGGTVFLGRAIVEAALKRGHNITLFNRGRSNPGLFPEVQRLFGDRSEDVWPLQGRSWDAAIDTSGYVPRVVRMSAEALADEVGHYTFISSLSVYSNVEKAGIDEDGPLGTLENPSVEEITGETYGPLKVACEQVVQEVMAERDLIIRPGLIVGPFDPTDRFTYWPYRVAHGGEVLAPGRPARQVQFIDVRDLAEWTIRLVETQQTGVYNATGPERSPSMQELLDTCIDASASDARFTWVSESFLEEHKVGPWMEMPLWVPESDPSNAGFFAFSSARARSAGLTFRPVAETVRATLGWLPQRPADKPWRAGISPQREAELLAAWHARTQT